MTLMKNAKRLGDGSAQVRGDLELDEGRDNARQSRTRRWSAHGREAWRDSGKRRCTASVRWRGSGHYPIGKMGLAA